MFRIKKLSRLWKRWPRRAATTGISGIVDPYGRVLARTKLMTETLLVGDIQPRTDRSIYTRHGDVLPALSLTLAGVFFILALIKNSDARKKSHQP
jgi:apolipoprotein N-acyltransferase